MHHVCQPISCKIGTLIYCIILLSIPNTNSWQMSEKNHSKAFVCLLFFILNKGLFKDFVNKTRRMHQRYFYSLRDIIIIMAMERTKWERIRKHLKNHDKEHSRHDKINTFFYSIFYLTTFFKSSIFYFSPTIYNWQKLKSSWLQHQSQAHFNNPGFPHQMTSEKRVQKFHTDDATLLRSG